MSLFNGIKWPYATMQQLNLDWILTEIKRVLGFFPEEGNTGSVLMKTDDGAAWEELPAIDVNINGVPEDTELTDTDKLIFYDVSSSANRKITAPNLLNSMMSNGTPLMDGTGSAGTSKKPARYDHRHPTDTSRAPASYFQNNALKIENGGTGATTLAGAKTSLGIQPADIVVDHEITAVIESGTIGTRGAQVSLPLDYPQSRLKSIIITGIGESSEYFPIVFNGDNNLYVNFYRASTQASSWAYAKIRCVYSGE